MEATKTNSLPLAARAQAEGRIPTREAFLFRGPEAVALAAAEPGKPARFKMTAVSGVPFAHPWYGNFVIDVETVKFKSQKFPILREHMAERIVGFTDKATSEGKVELEGVLSSVTADGKEVAALSAEGFPWEASVFARPGRVEFVKEGAETKVNGKTLKGPGTIFRDTLIEEASFCAIGADPRTKAKAFSGAESETEISCAFSKAGEAGKEPTMTVPNTTDTPAPAAAPAPATFSQADLDARVAAAVKADRENRAKLAAEIREFAAPGQEKLAAELIEKDTPLPEAMKALMRDAKEKLSSKREAFTKDPGAKIAPSAKAQEETEGAKTTTLSKVDEKDLIIGKGKVDEAAAKAKFAASLELQEEFGEEKFFLAYLKAESLGQTMTVVPRYVPV